MMRIGLAADHEGFALKDQLATALKAAGYALVDYGAHILTARDDYPITSSLWARPWPAQK